MKRLDNYLLTHFPLLWNLRLLYIWPAILLLHLLFWIAGYSSVSIPETLTYYSLEPGGGVISMATLCALLMLVLWLVFYFRNNGFKSFYPLAKGRLAAEFALLFITAIGLTTFTASYSGGVYTHVRAATHEVSLTDEANTSNLAHHFLPFSRQAFSTNEDCAYHPSRSLPDSLRKGGDDYSDRRGVSIDATDTFSFLHYCKDEYTYRKFKGLRTPAANDAIAKRWLYGGRKDSVAHVLSQYLKLCKKYGAAYRFDAVQGAAEVFATPGFLVRGEIGSSSSGTQLREESGLQAPPGDSVYIEEQRVSYALSAIDSARRGWLSWPGALFFLYFSLGIALLIFSFRTTSVLVWFIALIGTAVWMAIFGVLAAFMRGQDVGLMVLFIVLSLSFLVVSIVWIQRQRSKRNAGILLLWAFWSLPVLLPFTCELIKRLTPPHYYSHDNMLTRSPLYDWIEQHWRAINTGNLIFVLLMIFVLFIPLVRRWQAAPEE